MKWLAVILCFCVFVLSSSILNAQEANCVFKLKGKVLDSNTKKPLDFATLQLREINRTQLADENGSFVFDKLCKGNYTLACTHIGCATEYFIISITTDIVIKLELNHKDFDLTEVTVARHKKESAATQHVEQLEGKKLDELRGLSLGDALKTITGVSTLKTGSTISKPIVHGLHSNRVLILNNGIRQEGQQWGTEHAPEIDAFLAKRITLIKGASSLRYGSDAIGGVILVEPNPLPTNARVGGEVNYVVFSNNWEHNISAILEGNHTRVAPLSWRVQGTFKRAERTNT
jgi:iron complex outermembrane receptor protein